LAGHNKWSKIKHRKAVVDKRRGKVWTKCAKAIIVAARHGGADPDTNLALRYAIDEARYANMPRDTIERAIKKGAGGEDTSNYENVRYEGYGPGGVAVMVDALTDNRTRTAGDVRNIFGDYGGNFGATGCVGFLFESKGRIVLGPRQEDDDKASRRRGAAPEPAPGEDVIMEIALEAGAQDVIAPGESEDAWVILTAPTDFLVVRQSIEESLQSTPLAIVDAALDMIPSTTVQISAEHAGLLGELIDALEDNDDVQKVYTNAETPDEA
jgi:YebC/PmpR family DNA-binding regulatory protein